MGYKFVFSRTLALCCTPSNKRTSNKPLRWMLVTYHCYDSILKNFFCFTAHFLRQKELTITNLTFSYGNFSPLLATRYPGVVLEGWISHGNCRRGPTVRLRPKACLHRLLFVWSEHRLSNTRTRAIGFLYYTIFLFCHCHRRRRLFLPI